MRRKPESNSAKGARMARYGVSRSTTASAERVWSVWSDTANWSQWNSGIAGVELDRGLTLGSQGTMITKRGTKHPATVDHVDPPRSFSFVTTIMPLAKTKFICEIAPAQNGATIAQSVEFSGPLAFLYGPMMGKQMASHFVPVLDDLARAAES